MLVPKVARSFSSVSSTNEALIAALNGPASPPHGAVYLTAAQPGGRGQAGNRWHSSPGANLTLSLLLRPDRLSVGRLPALTQWAALAVRRAVHTCVPAQTVSVKWPNDVYVGDQKIAGVLIQNGLRGEVVQWSVVGIGLNVNEQDFPTALRQRATSLRQLTGESHSLRQVMATLFQALTVGYERIEREQWQTLRQEYHRHLYLQGVEATFTSVATGEPFHGVIQDTDAHGRLRILTEREELRTYDLREVEYLGRR